MASLGKLLDEGCDGDHVNLQIDSSSKRFAQGRGQPLASVRLCLLKHDLRTVQIQVSESVFWTLISDLEAQATYPERQAALHVRDHQLRN